MISKLLALPVLVAALTLGCPQEPANLTVPSRDIQSSSANAQTEAGVQAAATAVPTASTGVNRVPRCGTDEFGASENPPLSKQHWTKNEILAVFRKLSERPGGEGPSGEPPFWEVVSAGRDAVPLLIDLLTDRGPTGVTLWNGTPACAGDLAVIALLEISPELEHTIYDRFLSPPWLERYKDCGMCAYESFVKQPGSRERLKQDVLAWWNRANDLQWYPCGGVKNGGLWATQSGWKSIPKQIAE